MKTLILQRHGQAEPYAETDFERPLTDAGRAQIASAARRLKEQGFVPELILVSPLLRAKQSAEIMEQILGIPAQNEPLLDGRLSAQGLLDLARRKLTKTDTLLLIGHNPAMGIAAQLLCGAYMGFGTGAYGVFDMTDEKHPKLLLRG